MGHIRYAQGQDAWGLCKRCGLRFFLGELVFDGYLPGTRVCRECWEPRHPQEAFQSVSDPTVLYKPSPEDAPGNPVLTGVITGGKPTLSWTPVELRGGARVDSYLVQRAGMTLMTLPVTYYDGSLADLNETGAPAFGNDGIKSQTLTYQDTPQSAAHVYQVLAQLDSGRQAYSNLVTL